MEWGIFDGKWLLLGAAAYVYQVSRLWLMRRQAMRFTETYAHVAKGMDCYDVKYDRHFVASGIGEIMPDWIFVFLTPWVWSYESYIHPVNLVGLRREIE